MRAHDGSLLVATASFDIKLGVNRISLGEMILAHDFPSSNALVVAVSLPDGTPLT